jgi:hypothetical protein
VPANLIAFAGLATPVTLHVEGDVALASSARSPSGGTYASFPGNYAHLRDSADVNGTSPLSAFGTEGFTVSRIHWLHSQASRPPHRPHGTPLSIHRKPLVHPATPLRPLVFHWCGILAPTPLFA